MAEGKFTNETIKMTEEQRKAQKARNRVIGLVIAAFILVVYFATWAKLGANILQRPL